MWTLTPRGFFSAVQHDTDPDLLVVRTRDHGDAEYLLNWYTTWRLGHDDAAAPEPAITTYEWSDYPWRVILPRTAWERFLAAEVDQLDYGNFKDAVKARQGNARAHVYARVWEALLALEDLDPDGRRLSPWASVLGPDDAPSDDWYASPGAPQ